MSYYDFPPNPSLEDLEKAAADIKRQRQDDWKRWNGAGYDYIPEPTIREAWEHIENQKWPDR